MSQPSKESEKLKDLTTQVETTRKVVRSKSSMPLHLVGSTAFIGSREKKTLTSNDNQVYSTSTRAKKRDPQESLILPINRMNQKISSDSYFSTVSDK
jgi:hypothetical protein